MKDGFVRVAAGSPELRVADTRFNGEKILEMMREMAANGAKIAVFPEMCITGYTIQDLVFQPVLLQGAMEALQKIAAASDGLDMLTVVGLPVACKNSLYNCAAIVKNGKILGLIPKTHIPNYGEFYEARHFASGKDICEQIPAFGGEAPIPLCANQIFSAKDMPDLCVGVEICEDLWAPNPPGTELALSGATILVNPSASDEVVGKAEYRRQLVAGQSARLVCCYIYCDANWGESTQDMVFGGHNIIAENGVILAESTRFEGGAIYADVDVGFLAAERRRMNTFRSHAEMTRQSFTMRRDSMNLRRFVDPMPFVPSDPAKREARCEEILSIQAHGLARRLMHTHAGCAVVGVSGGLDSTLAMLVAARALKIAGLPAETLLAVTMPCFGTTNRTYQNALKLAQGLGARLKEVRIGDAVKQHFSDIGLPETDRSVSYENSQARERTQVLMDLANMHGGLVIGTGDLSELALGWATYNGDHMSMYGVNASVPKTLIRYLVRYCADKTDNALLREVLLDVLDTPVSPELLPPEEDGEIAQKTEDLVGPYELHDFFLYHMVRRYASPEKLLRLANVAFAGKFEGDFIEKWLKTFLRRFFQQQFKRSCLPDGPKVGTVTLSPRGDWRMPTDAFATLWTEFDRRRTGF